MEAPTIQSSKNQSMKRLKRGQNTVSPPQTKPSRHDKTPHKRSKTKQSSRHHRRRRLSAIESLPTELVEHIFLFTANPSFPRSSPFIARKLSRRHIYELQCRRLFSSFKSAEPCPPECAAQSLVPAESETELARAQRETLRCRWMTPELFDEVSSEMLSEERARRWQFMQDNTCASDADSPATADPQKLKAMTYTVELWLGPSCQIPPKLLRWPPSDGARRFLDTLVMAGCQVDWSNSLNGERALEAWQEAVRHRDYRMVHRLMSFGIMVRPTDGELEAAFQTVDWEIPMIRLIATSVVFTLPAVSESVVHFYKKNYPKTFVGMMARHPHRTPGREHLMTFDNYYMIDTWQGSPRSLAASKFKNGTKYKPDGPNAADQFQDLGRWYPPAISIARGYYIW